MVFGEYVFSNRLHSNLFVESHADIKLPTRVNVELQAKDMNSWMHVQELAQNPRVKTALPLQKRLSSLIQYLNERWKSQNALIVSFL